MTKGININFLPEIQLFDEFDVARIKVGMRNKSGLMRAFVRDFSVNPKFYSERLLTLYKSEERKDSKKVEDTETGRTGNVEK